MVFKVRWPGAVLAVSLAGCASAQRMPTANEIASDMERKRCGPDVEEGALAPIFNKEAIQGWDSAYLAASTCGGGAGGCYKRLAGAVIVVKALQGFTAEWLDRALECHSARRVLGKIPPGDIPNDPFWLPGKTVDIDVVSTGGQFAATVRTLEPSDAQEIINRTKAFVEPGPAR
jgi:hypothetical protein